MRAEGVNSAQQQKSTTEQAEKATEVFAAVEEKANTLKKDEDYRAVLALLIPLPRQQQERLRKLIAELHMPPGYSARLQGQTQVLDETTDNTACIEKKFVGRSRRLHLPARSRRVLTRSRAEGSS